MVNLKDLIPNDLKNEEERGDKVGEEMKNAYWGQKDLIPDILKHEEEGGDEGKEEMRKEIEETMLETMAALEKIVRLSTSQPNNVPKQSSDSKYINYKPFLLQLAAFNSGAKERVIRMVKMPKERIIRMGKMPVDPLEPPKFKYERAPKASGSPPVPVMRSPPRPLTVKDEQDWKFPPCLSNWKNPSGYAIPLDMRLAVDGRCLPEVQSYGNFAKLSKALYVAEQKAREAVAIRSQLQKEMMMKEKERKEQELPALAAKARSERTGGIVASSVAVPISSDRNSIDTDDMRVDYEPVRVRETDMAKETQLQREKIPEEHRGERNAVIGNKRKIARDRYRDISEKVTLGREVMYDQRLFNQEKGMDSGFATDDQCNIYDKGLFTAQPTLSTLYRPKKDMDSDLYGGADERLEKIIKTKAFAGTSEKSGPRDRPVEFEKEAEEADPFDFDQFLREVKKGKKAMEKLYSGGMMKASAGSSMPYRYGGGSNMSQIGFERGH